MGRVLVVEDDPGCREALALVLGLEGYEIRTARDGGEALAVLEHWTSNLIVLDLVLPELDGPALLRALRDTSFEHVPVIVVSAAAQLEARTSSLGVAGVIQKPFQLDAMLHLVKAFCADRTVSAS